MGLNNGRVRGGKRRAKSREAVKVKGLRRVKTGRDKGVQAARDKVQKVD